MRAGPLRQLAYRHRWIYDGVTALSSLPVGGPGRLRALAAEWLIESVAPGAAVLDLCCGSGYCGDFGGTTGTTVCGLNTQNHQLSTGCSCDVTGAGGVGSAGLLAGLGLALGAIIRRRRR